ncbi:hypothetical protein PE066_03915 [Ramlibacter tataouinensis]|uniref:hypothetical protein n=1 Tax=Ramlibacter tataouinensis TaxID=94132 RepID=UPI0022F3D3FE|nr:hypothetical protein [Ramlibacter tataouinensis]WBY02696.1 hypothetical protein PE066_03915 [Ramlibacter tataouinensis]
MNLRNTLPSLATAAALLACAVQSQPAMVSVDLSEVASQLAQRNSLDESLMPLSILVPPEVAARVCGMAAGARALMAAGCTAASSSTELDRLVKARMDADELPPTPPPRRPPDD